MSSESMDPLALHDQPKSKDDSGTCSARSLMEQGRTVHLAGDWKQTSSAAEKTHGSDISTIPGEELSSSTSNYDVPSSSPQSTTTLQQQEAERIRRLYREPSQEEIDYYKPQVRQKLLNARQQFPSGHGLMVGFSSKNGCQGTQPLKNIQNSRKICQSYKRLGYATCFFLNPNRAQMLAVYQELAQSDILENFKVFVSFYTGHGQHNYISLKDGYLSIASLKNILSKAEAPNLQGKVRCLIFDCCRVNADVEEVDKPVNEENLFIFYTVPKYQQSFVVDAAGLSVATSELIKMLDQDQPRSIKAFFTLLKQKIPKAVELICNAIDCGDIFNPTITVPVNFFQDKINSMSATNVVLTDDPDSEMCLLTWRRPEHADHHTLTGYFVASQEKDSTWVRMLQEDIDPAVTQLHLRRDQILCKRLSIGAKYEEREVIAADHGVCPEVYLLSEDIKPENVHLNIKTKKEATISWENPATCPEGDNLFVSLGNRHKQRTGRLEGDWDCLENRIKCDNKSYSINLGNPDSYDYRIRRHMDDIYSEWVTPIRRDIGREQRMKTRLRCLIVLSIVLMITTILAIVIYSSIVYVVPSSRILAIPGDVIDCENLKPEKTKLYSNVELKQETEDDPNDNDDGIALIVTSIHIPETWQNSGNYTGYIDTTLSDKGKYSIIEDTYYTNPIYMWKGSNISMQVDIKEYTTPPTKTEGYIICGEENYLSFHNNKDSFHYVHKFIISRDYTVLPSTAVDQNCYYYVGIRIYAESSVRVLAVINMDYFYVNSSNPAFSQGISLSPTDGTVKYPIDFYGNKIVVCGSKKSVDSSISVLILN